MVMFINTTAIITLGGEVTADRESQRRDFSLTDNSLRNVMQSQPKKPKMNL